MKKAEIQKVQKAIIEMFGGQHLSDHSGGCFDAQFWTEEEWMMKHPGHKAGGFYMVYDGGMVYSGITNEFGYTVSENLDTLLSEHGFWREDYSSWATHIMPKD